MPIVIDASVALAWTLPDERDEAAQQILERVLLEGALAPALWRWELQNALWAAERRGRIATAETADALANLRALPVATAPPPPFGRELEIARRHNLSVYDAAYLYLAIETNGGELATADKKLASTADGLGILAAESRPFLEAP